MSSSFAALETLPPARASARCSAARSAASTPSPSPRASADQVRRRHRPRQSLSVEAKRQPRGARRADNEIVAVDRHQRGARAFARGRQHNARVGKGEAEVLGFDRARRVRHDHADQTLQSLRSGPPGTRRRRWPRRGRHARRRSARSCRLRSTLRVKKCWSRSIVTARCSTRQVPMPFVPSNFSLHTAPVHKPQPSKVESSQGAPRRSTTTPSLSASSTEQPTPPTARNSRSKLACATRRSGPSRSLASAIRAMGKRCEGVAARRIERVQAPGPSPRSRERRARGVGAGYDLENTVRVVRVRGAPHAFLPPAPTSTRWASRAESRFQALCINRYSAQLTRGI